MKGLLQLSSEDETFVHDFAVSHAWLLINCTMLSLIRKNHWCSSTGLGLFKDIIKHLYLKF